MQTQSYHIQSLLGEGGMAKVYLAEHKTLGHKVAIKVLNREYVHNENIRKRFLAEARNLAKMNHPHVVRVMDLIEEGDTVAFVMEYIEGQTLRAYLDQKGKLPDEEIKKLFGQMLEAVGYVHEQGLVHRDIKPSNFMLDSRGNIKLLDFGIAKTLDASSAEYTQTATTQHMGTPMYMSPEQVKSTKDVTAQSDIYSLGVVLWQMAAGRKPYDTSTLSTFEIQTKIVSEELPETGSKWDDVISLCIKKDPNDRFKAIENGNLKGKIRTKTKVIVQDKNEETVAIPIQKPGLQRPELERDKIFTETIKDPNERGPFSFEPWVTVLLVLGSILIIAILLINNSGQTSDSDNLETNIISERPLSDTAALNEILQNFILVEGGKFKMGCPATDLDSFICESDEYPIREVELTSYFLSNHEITQYQWESIMGNIPEQYFKCQNCPVGNVTKEQIDAFIKVLNSKTTGPPFVLPTEAQWEYAARGGNNSKGYIYSGSNIAQEAGWVNDSLSTYKPIRSKISNEIGIYDMTGNVWEICSDFYGAYSNDELLNPKGITNGSAIVIRGGSFYHNIDKSRCTYRSSFNLNEGNSVVGFRLAVSKNTPTAKRKNSTTPDTPKEPIITSPDPSQLLEATNVENEQSFKDANIGVGLEVVTEKSEPVNVRLGPSSTSESIGWVWHGDWNGLVLVNSSSLPWIKVRGKFYHFDSGKADFGEGFVHVNFLKIIGQ